MHVFHALGGARLGRAARRRVLPAPPPARCVAGGAGSALRPRRPRHRQGSRCRGGGAHRRGRRTALVGTGRVLRQGRSGAAPLRRLARAGGRRGDDLPRCHRRRDRCAARRLRRTGSTRPSSSSPGSRAELHLGDEGGHLPLALGLLGLVALGTAAWLVFRPVAAPRALPDPEVRHAVEELVRRHGHDTLAFFKLRGDQQYLFTDDGAAFLGYRVESGVMLCAGDPDRADAPRCRRSSTRPQRSPRFAACGSARSR